MTLAPISAINFPTKRLQLLKVLTLSLKSEVLSLRSSYVFDLYFLYTTIAVTTTTSITTTKQSEQLEQQSQNNINNKTTTTTTTTYFSLN